MKHAISLPPVGEMSDPHALVEAAVAAEAAGWDGVFIWDHVLRRAEEPPEVADPWVAMAAMAVATSTVRIGPMVTPITRRRPIKLARECITLDQLSRGRLTLGLGLGVDTSRELTGFGEILDPKIRGQRLDEGVELLCEFWSGEQVNYHGEHFIADGVTVLPRPVQRPRIPLWFAARGTARKPVRRAARYDGLFPIEIDEAGLVSMLDVVREERGNLDGFDVVAQPKSAAEYDRMAEIGATWMFAVTMPADGDALAIASTPPADYFS